MHTYARFFRIRVFGVTGQILNDRVYVWAIADCVARFCCILDVALLGVFPIGLIAGRDSEAHGVPKLHRLRVTLAPGHRQEWNSLPKAWPGAIVYIAAPESSSDPVYLAVGAKMYTHRFAYFWNGPPSFQHVLSMPFPKTCTVCRGGWADRRDFVHQYMDASKFHASYDMLVLVSALGARVRRMLYTGAF